MALSGMGDVVGVRGTLGGYANVVQAARLFRSVIASVDRWSTFIVSLAIMGH